MAGCMMFVFAALGEFVVVKVLDVQYQYQLTIAPKIVPIVSNKLIFSFCFILKKKIILKSAIECNGKRTMSNCNELGV